MSTRSHFHRSLPHKAPGSTRCTLESNSCPGTKFNHPKQPAGACMRRQCLEVEATEALGSLCYLSLWQLSTAPRGASLKPHSNASCSLVCAHICAFIYTPYFVNVGPCVQLCSCGNQRPTCSVSLSLPLCLRQGPDASEDPRIHHLSCSRSIIMAHMF